MIHSIRLPLLFLLLLSACQSRPDARRIIAQAIEAHGGERYQHVRVEADFRQFHLRLEQQGGRFRYERRHRDSTGAVLVEILSNDGVTRSVNGQPQPLDSAQRSKWSNAVNAVAYFLLLPHKLADPAVIPAYLGETTVEGRLYDKIRVTFSQEGGGQDFEDTFFYWFNRQTHTMDYLAYREGGPRFRKAINPRTVGGIRFQDYLNYAGDEADTTSVGDYDRKFERGELKLLSRIEQKNVRVTALP